MTYLVPILIFVFLFFFAFFQWRTYYKSPKYNGKYDQHNDRIYKDFEFFVKVFIALVGAIGFIRFNYYEENHEVARQAMQGIGAIALLTMISISIFIICHQGSKIRRWEKVEWKNLFFWQELWMVISMYLFASILWIVSNKW
jgi:multisubunit Na+/H+ antiporter MnhG subunit